MKGKHQGFVSASLAVAAMLLFQMPTPVSAQAADPVTAAPAEQSLTREQVDMELEEVVVEGTSLIQRIDRLRERFFKLYNELNDKDEFNVNCTSIVDGRDSLVTRRACLPSFYVQALDDQLSWAARCQPEPGSDEEGQAEVYQQVACYTPPTAEFVMFARRDEYEKHAWKVISSDPRLLEMEQEGRELNRQLHAVDRKLQELEALKPMVARTRHRELSPR